MLKFMLGMGKEGRVMCEGKDVYCLELRFVPYTGYIRVPGSLGLR